MSYASSPDVTFIDQPVPPRKIIAQFPTKTLFIATAVIAAILAAFIAPPVALFALLFLFLAATVVLATASVCARGWFRAFAIGAIVPNAITYFVLLAGVNSPQQALVSLIISLISSFCFGGLAAATHGFLRKRKGRLPIPAIPLVSQWLTNE